MAGHGGRRVTSEFVLADGEGHDRRRGRVEAGGSDRAGEGNRRIPHHAREDHVGLRRRDRRRGGRKIGGAEGHIRLAGEFRPQAGELIPDDLVDAPRPDVVGSHEKEAAGLEGVEAPLHRRRDLLVRSGSGVDDAGRLLEPLIGHRVDEQMVGGLDNR